MANNLYDMIFKDTPAVAPYGPEDFAWFGTKLADFGTERMIAAGELAKAATAQELEDSKSVRDLLGAIWDAVSCELDDSYITAENYTELERMETHLAQSAHVLRPIVGCQANIEEAQFAI